MIESDLSDLQSLLHDLGELCRILGYVWSLPGGIRFALLEVDKDELTILAGIPVRIVPREEEPRSTTSGS